MHHKKLAVFFDGGSRNYRTRGVVSGAGAAYYLEGKKQWEICAPIEKNNIAEYTAASQGTAPTAPTNRG
ncbi:hypothetical protein DIPPA_03136 [Diplonema papillatum]|nr:hypothetical protein DIPPA_03136 [Diplonema papillatum]